MIVILSNKLDLNQETHFTIHGYEFFFTTPYSYHIFSIPNLNWFKYDGKSEYNSLIEQRILDANAGKQLSYAATDV